MHFNKNLATKLLVLAAIVAPSIVWAENYNDIKSISQGLSVQIHSLKMLLLQVALICGIGFSLAGMVKFKAHKDNPTQVALSVPVTLLLIGAGLVFLPNIIDASGRSIFGSDSQAIDDPFDFN